MRESRTRPGVMAWKVAPVFAWKDPAERVAAVSKASEPETRSTTVAGGRRAITWLSTESAIPEPPPMTSTRNGFSRTSSPATAAGRAEVGV
jgi:hypothetical protein